MVDLRNQLRDLSRPGQCCEGLDHMIHPVQALVSHRHHPASIDVLLRPLVAVEFLRTGPSRLIRRAGQSTDRDRREVDLVSTVQCPDAPPVDSSRQAS